MFKNSIVKTSVYILCSLSLLFTILNISTSYHSSIIHAETVMNHHEDRFDIPSYNFTEFENEESLEFTCFIDHSFYHRKVCYCNPFLNSLKFQREDRMFKLLPN